MRHTLCRVSHQSFCTVTVPPCLHLLRMHFAPALLTAVVIYALATSQVRSSSADVVVRRPVAARPSGGYFRASSSPVGHPACLFILPMGRGMCGNVAFSSRPLASGSHPPICLPDAGLLCSRPRAYRRLPSPQVPILNKHSIVRRPQPKRIRRAEKLGSCLSAPPRHAATATFPCPPNLTSRAGLAEHSLSQPPPRKRTSHRRAPFNPRSSQSVDSTRVWLLRSDTPVLGAGKSIYQATRPATIPDSSMPRPYDTPPLICCSLCGGHTKFSASLCVSHV